MATSTEFLDNTPISNLEESLKKIEEEYGQLRRSLDDQIKYNSTIRKNYLEDSLNKISINTYGAWPDADQVSSLSLLPTLLTYLKLKNSDVKNDEESILEFISSLYKPTNGKKVLSHFSPEIYRFGMTQENLIKEALGYTNDNKIIFLVTDETLNSIRFYNVLKKVIEEKKKNKGNLLVLSVDHHYPRTISEKTNVYNWYKLMMYSLSDENFPNILYLNSSIKLDNNDSNVDYCASELEYLINKQVLEDLGINLSDTNLSVNGADILSIASAIGIFGDSRIKNHVLDDILKNNPQLKELKTKKGKSFFWIAKFLIDDAIYILNYSEVYNIVKGLVELNLTGYLSKITTLDTTSWEKIRKAKEIWTYFKPYKFYNKSYAPDRVGDNTLTKLTSRGIMRTSNLTYLIIPSNYEIVSIPYNDERITKTTSDLPLLHRVITNAISEKNKVNFGAIIIKQDENNEFMNFSIRDLRNGTSNAGDLCGALASVLGGFGGGHPVAGGGVIYNDSIINAENPKLNRNLKKVLKALGIKDFNNIKISWEDVPFILSKLIEDNGLLEEVVSSIN